MYSRFRTAAAVLWIAAGATAVAHAGAKDESAADWLPLPKALKDWRDTLADKGIAFGATYIADNIANTSGGVKRGGIHFGRLDLGVDADFEKLFGWSGTKLHANMFRIYGDGLTRNNVNNLATISEIEALPETRLYEAWIEKSWGESFSIKAGQQAADVEFFDSKTDDLFVNGTFGWPAIKASNLPAGGPAPPIAVPGVRVKADLSKDVTVFGAVFNGNPAAPGAGDPQLRDRHGTAFRVNDDPWFVGQTRFTYDLNLGFGSAPGSFTPGGWYHTGEFNDQRFASPGLSIADPSGSGVAQKLRGNYGVFFVLEQTLYRAKADTDAGITTMQRGVTAFGRAAYSPPDRNLIDFYADGGIGFNGMIAQRPLDRFGFAVAYMHISSVAQQLDRDTQVFSGLPSPVRSNEILLEAIYEAHVLPGWLVQPFFQYVIRPSGGIVNPNDPAGIARIGDAAVFGLTTTLKY
jgi:porin